MNQHRPASFSSLSNAPALLGAAAILAAVLLYAWPLSHAVLMQDDFQILAQSWTWQKTLNGLLAPNNEHVMPLSRLLVFVVVQLAGRTTALPFFGVLTGVVGLILAMVLTHLFVRRELGHAIYGLFAMILFGVSAVYQQAVYWFAASFSVYALVTMLLALLAAQHYRHNRQWGWLSACIAGCALAPCWFASGVLAGPFCCLYLLPTEGEDRRRGLIGWLLRLTPLLGTAVFLGVVWLTAFSTIQHLYHYQVDNTTALEAFKPLTGAWFTVRSVVDNLGLGLFGITDVTVGPIFAAPLILLLFAAGAWWAWRSPQRRLALLGAGLIFGSYLLIYSGRAAWGYDEVRMYTPTWSRYHLQPQLGLVLLLCGGLPAWEGRWFRLDATGPLTRGQTWALAVLLGVSFLIQAPRGALCYYRANLPQAETLRRLDRVSTFCQEHHISADAATQILRGELGKLDMEHESATHEDGWEFVYGSDHPSELSEQERNDLVAAAR
ncbi:MAG TPA: hypothetical protein VMS17_00685 [Gemmataceae bacterium]|nr:hypothetical protein [Gemmataceae bacterium]